MARGKHRKRMPVQVAKGICDRFAAFVKHVFGSWAEFERETGIPRTTYSGWRRQKNPNIPGIQHLVCIARDSGLDLNWLLLEQGEMLRERKTTTFQGEFLAKMEAELRATEDVSSDEAEEVWKKMVIGMDHVWTFAVDGVRPAYREVLHGHRMWWEASLVLRGVTEGFVSNGELPPEVAEQVSGKLQEIAERHLDRALNARLSSAN